MDLLEALRQLSVRIENIKPQIQTEEATKMSLIIPFFQILGYDVFNPHEFIPEFSADVGIKKGEKVDYAITMNNNPVILIEAKACNVQLEKHDSQLFRYFGTTKAKFCILTNGLIYKFYTDLEEKNKMDLTPFLEFDITNIKESIVMELKKFQKENFNIENIFSTASELKYSKSIKEYIASQLTSPNDEFVRLIASAVYSGMKTQAIMEKFKPLVQRALNEFITERMNDKITMALKVEAAAHEEEKKEQQKAEAEAPKIVTTSEEIEAFYAVKSILFGILPIEKISFRDTENYIGILYDNNIRKWICRFDLNGTKKKLYIPDENKDMIKIELESSDAIYKHKDEIVKSAKRFID
jgi:hypothetical protein